MTALIAQVAVPTDGISSGLFMPLLFGAVVYVILLVAGTVLENRADPRGDAVSDIAFAVLLLLGVYTLVLLITALGSQFELFVDMARIMAIVIVFFAILLLVLFGVSLLFGLIGSRARRKKRVTT